MKKAFKGNDSFSNFIQSLILTGAQQTHLRKHLVKSAMVQKIALDSALLNLIFVVLVDYAKYARNFENGERTKSFSTSQFSSSLSVGDKSWCII